MNIPEPKFESAGVVDLSPLYPISIQQLDNLHWSPSPVIIKVVEFLTGDGSAEILDIGSGPGKFCLVGSFLRPDCIFYGVEQRENLVDQANRIKDLLGRDNVIFFHKNFTQLDLRRFSGFYFYNSFFENLPGTEKIDESMDYSVELYHYYSLYLKNQLEGMPSGTRIATYCSWGHEIPADYREMKSDMEDLLKFWIKS